MARTIYTQICDFCKQPFGNPRIRKFCSNKCNNKSRVLPRTNITCKNSDCQEVFEHFGIVKREFCSQSCAATYNNTVTPKRQSGLNKCFVCPRQCRTKSRLYCSPNCRSIHLTAMWLNGDISGATKFGHIRNYIRRYIRSLTNDACAICGWNEINPVSGVIPTQIDHIDGNFLNNKPENLILLCPNHHALTNTFGNLNKGKQLITRKQHRNVVVAAGSAPAI